MKLHPTLAFGFAVVSCAAWLGFVIVAGPYIQPYPPAHILALASVLLVGGGAQFGLTRAQSLSRPHRTIQVIVAAVLAPTIAWSFLYLLGAAKLHQGG